MRKAIYMTLKSGKVLVVEFSDVRLDQYVSEKQADISRTRAARLIREGYIKLDGRVVKPSAKLSLGQKISIRALNTQEVNLQAEDIPLSVVYQDEDIIVINKPPGMLVHPGAGHPGGTLMNAVLSMCPELSGMSSTMRPGLVHRLDKDTSGIIIVAKNEKALTDMSDQFKNRLVVKKYMALVKGNLSDRTAIIDGPIRRDRSERKRMSVAEGGKESTTRYELMQRYRSFDMVDVIPLTGRTHQIRVHFSSIGHPVAGDALYGGKTDRLDRQFLHAYSLSFRHPTSGDDLCFDSKLPKDLSEFTMTLFKDA